MIGRRIFEFVQIFYIFATIPPYIGIELNSLCVVNFFHSVICCRNARNGSNQVTMAT